MLVVDYLPQKTTMTGPYCGEVLTNLRQEVKERRRGILTRGPLLLHGNAPANMARVAQAAQFHSRNEFLEAHINAMLSVDVAQQ